MCMKITQINSLNGKDSRVIVHYSEFFLDKEKSSNFFDYEKVVKIARKVSIGSRRYNMNTGSTCDDQNLCIAFTFEGDVTDEKVAKLEAEITALKV